MMLRRQMHIGVDYSGDRDAPVAVRAGVRCACVRDAAAVRRH